ncbi:LamG-like jellyroll fold domain-containing protein [Chloroflexota bacterium]
MNEEGFTLGELLVVIAIMTILVSVSVGAFAGLIGSGRAEAAQFEKMAVQTAIDSYMGITASSTISARLSAAVIASSDSDAPFNTYLRRLPTKYEYTWIDTGSVTQYGAPAGGAGGGSDPGGGASLPTPIAQWHLDESDGAAAVDSIGSNHGVVMGGPQWVSGRVNNCLNLNSTGVQYVIVNPFSGFPSNETTVEFWMRSSDPQSGTAFSYAVSGSDNEFIVFNYTNFTIYRGSSRTNPPTGISANDGAWHHIAVSWRGSDGATKIYKDGNPVWNGTLAAGTTITAGGSLVLGQEQDSVGGGFNSSQDFVGLLDEVAVYDEVLDDSEILAIYNSY